MFISVGVSIGEISVFVTLFLNVFRLGLLVMNHGRLLHNLVPANFMVLAPFADLDLLVCNKCDYLVLYL